MLSVLKKFRRDTPTAELSKQSGEKRKIDSEHESALVTKQHMRAIGYFGAVYISKIENKEHCNIRTENVTP